LPLFKYSSNLPLFPADSDFFYLSYFKRNLKGNFSGFQILQNFQSFNSFYSFIVSLRTDIPLLKHSPHVQLLPRKLKGSFRCFKIFQIFQYLKPAYFHMLQGRNFKPPS
ncbi:hypothetical protein LDENG_00278440, partial [Lucifuga dentata]